MHQLRAFTSRSMVTHMAGRSHRPCYHAVTFRSGTTARETGYYFEAAQPQRVTLYFEAAQPQRMPLHFEAAQLRIMLLQFDAAQQHTLTLHFEAAQLHIVPLHFEAAELKTASFAAVPSKRKAARGRQSYPR